MVLALKLRVFEALVVTFHPVKSTATVPLL